MDNIKIGAQSPPRTRTNKHPNDINAQPSSKEQYVKFGGTVNDAQRPESSTRESDNLNREVRTGHPALPAAIGSAFIRSQRSGPDLSRTGIAGKLHPPDNLLLLHADTQIPPPS